MIEALESRIAPAAVVTFFEADGDKITVKTNQGTSTDLNTALGGISGTTLAANTVPVLDFLTTPQLATEFGGTNVSVTAKAAPGSKAPTAKAVDGISIIAYQANGTTNIDLGKVSVAGTLTSIDAGDTDLDTFAVKSITVKNWGPIATGTETISHLQGDVKTVTVKNDFSGAIVSVDPTGAQNYADANQLGTRIGTFKAKTIANEDGDNNGFLQVYYIGKLSVTDTFYGSTNGSMNNGLIQAALITKIAITTMVDSATIQLSA